MAHIPASPPANEAARLAALRRYDILDTPIEQGFEDLTRLASFICGTPISTVTFVDERRQWFKSHRGIDDAETPRDQAFCAHAILQQDVFIVPDATLDDRFSANPLVTSNPNIRFYAGAPLITADGLGLGTLCVIDRVPRTLTDDQLEALRALSRRTMAQLEMRKTLGDLYLAYRELESLAEAKGDFVSMVSRQLQAPLRGIGDRLARVLADPAALAEAEQRQAIGDALASTRRLEELSNEALDFSAAETGTIALRRDVCDVADLLASARDAPLLAPHGERRVEAQADDEAGMIAGDADRLVEALVKLLQVAIGYAPASEPVTIGAKAAGDGVEIVIRAEGPGMSPNDRARLFQPFSLGAGRGSALGLGPSTAKAIIEQHRGTVRVVGEVGDGTTFVVSLPRK